MYFAGESAGGTAQHGQSSEIPFGKVRNKKKHGATKIEELKELWKPDETSTGDLCSVQLKAAKNLT